MHYIYVIVKGLQRVGSTSVLSPREQENAEW